MLIGMLMGVLIGMLMDVLWKLQMTGTDFKAIV
jgi:hypothetical protein